jgi:A/G-specific adenine glycosylase
MERDLNKNMNKNMNKNLISDKDFHQKIIAWYERHGRKDFPWQKNKTLYSVWVSEIMLQQTQVTTVIPYYEKFLNLFPTVEKLAHASHDEVMSLWAGLGYYARARNLHKTAKIITQDFQGIFPNTLEAMMKLPGIGRSTAGAILSLTLNTPYPILDGNVKRVLSRYFCESQEKKLWAHAEALIQPDHAAHYTQAMMDLGASVCTRLKPKCTLCPLIDQCQAKLTNQIDLFPEKSKTKQKEDQVKHILIFSHQNKIFLERRPSSGIWGGLFAFPLVDMDQFSPELFQSSDKTSPTTHVEKIDIWPERVHIFSHFRLRYTPIHLSLLSRESFSLEKLNGEWYDYEEALNLGLPQPIKAIVLELLELFHESTSAAR